MSFCINDKYAQHLAVVLTSILVNNPEEDFIFHILHSNVTDESITRVKELEKMYPRNRIVFHHVDPSRFSSFKIPVQLEHVSVETYYRYLLPELLLDEDRTIYSDVDVLCQRSLDGLWNYDLKGNLLGAVRNYEAESRGYREQILAKFGFSASSPYFFTGFLVMDLKALRAGGYVRSLVDRTCADGAKLPFIDLDVVNLVCEGRILEMSEEWNCTSRYRPWKANVRIWHFLGWTQKPWCNIWKNITWIPYLRYLRKSPYADKVWSLIWGHIKGFFYFRYEKKGVTRHLVCGIRVWRSKARG